MAKIKIEDATNAQLDYAVAVALGWDVKIHNGMEIKINGRWDSENKGKVLVHTKEIKSEGWWCLYSPTSDQAQCGVLIDEFKISARFDNGFWYETTYHSAGFVSDRSRLVAAVKAFIWSKNPDGMIGVE